MAFGAHVQRATSTGLAERVGGLTGAKIPPAAVKALSKMLAFFVICIGVQILWEGIQALRG